MNMLIEEGKVLRWFYLTDVYSWHRSGYRAHQNKKASNRGFFVGDLPTRLIS